MPRTLLSALQIQKQMIAAVNRDDRVAEHNLDLLVGAPTWREPTGDGCNWHVEYTPRYDGFMNTIRSVIADAQQRFNLI